MGQIRQTIPDDLHRWLKARAAEAGVSLQDYLVRLIQEAKDKEQQ
jgi:predicted HicB family RNase H-like nuclease